MSADTNPSPPEPEVRQALGERVYQGLRRAIIRCEIEPGLQITEGQLAERFGTSKTTIRVVLNRLAHERLVQVLPREGYLITPLTLKQVQDLFGARLILEPAVARLAAGNLSADDERTLRDLCEQRYRVGDQESIETFLGHNTTFHVTVARASGNDRLADMVGDLLDEMQRVLHFSYLLGDRNEETHSEHEALLGALLAGDADLAEQVVAERLRDDRRVLLDALLASPALQSISLTAARQPVAAVGGQGT